MARQRTTATEEAARSGAAEPGPTPPEDRIVGLDALRGFALLGILVINMWYFSMPLAGAVLPTAYGDLTGINYVAWFVGHVFFEMKFVTLFTLMFGAGIVLFTQSKERKGQPAQKLHYRRTVWLLVIGLGHAYLLWYGDILVTYALAGFIVVLARDWDSRQLVKVGLAMLTVQPALYLLMGFLALGIGGEEALPAAEEQIRAGFGATDSGIAAELAAYRGGWFDQFSHRVPNAFSLQTSDFVAGNFWHLGGLMLIGMAAFKRGVLSNERSTGWYRRVFVGGVLLGLSLTIAGVAYRHLFDWETIHTTLFAFQFTYWGSLPLAAGYVAGIMLWCRRRSTGIVTVALAAVGRTAFSNYLLQTVIATSIFYGHGLGLFGRVTRAEGLAIVLLIWAVQIPLSVLWLRYFRFGPVEWVWRTLTYGQRQPVRKRSSD